MIFVILLLLSAFLIFGEIALCAVCGCYALRSLRAYSSIGRQVWARAMPAKEQLKASQRLYWRYICGALSRNGSWDGRDERRQWLEAHAGASFSIREDILNFLRGIALAVMAVVVWPAALLVHSLILGVYALRNE